MITPDIISYVKIERAKNTPDAQIKTNLLANGWNENDITEAMSSSTSELTAKINDPALKEHRNKVKWITFFVLIVIDALIILWFRVADGIYGLFGISILSVILRILFIYLIAYVGTRGSSPKDSTPKIVMGTIGRVLGTILIALLIILGIFFASCLFIVYTGGLRGL